eukprot:TRINITY_DN61968_c0_g1_i1.p1 TRINITY_DN61968_c0_g1~~TRINITY_DN61968_c0_g1_i1.p1  ORF type:complete len:341 (-),score=52.00 TRINITY_DN61968_c0_g1_i1:174-1196(-)
METTVIPEWETMEIMFDLFDDADTGALDYASLNKLMRAMGRNPTDDLLKCLIDEVQDDLSSKIDFMKFVAVTARYKAIHDPVEKQKADERKLLPLPKHVGMSGVTFRNVRDVFDLYDTNGSNVLRPDAVIRCMNAIGHQPSPSDINRLIVTLLKNTKMEVGIADFVKLVVHYQSLHGPRKRRQRKPLAFKISISKISLEMICEYREMFDLFDEKMTGALEHDTIGKVMRALGLFPTNAEIKRLTSKFDGLISFPEFLALMTRYTHTMMSKDDPDERLVQAFKTFDTAGDGTVSGDVLRGILTTMGEPLTDAEVDDLFEQLKLTNNCIAHYRDLILDHGVL